MVGLAPRFDEVGFKAYMKKTPDILAIWFLVENSVAGVGLLFAVNRVRLDVTFEYPSRQRGPAL